MYFSLHCSQMTDRMRLVAILCLMSGGFYVESVPIPGLSPSFPCVETQRGGMVSDLECVVNQGQYLNYSKIREVTNSGVTGTKYNVTVTCNGGQLYLPWPFRAANVFALSVHGCRILGFFAERFVPQVYPDELLSVLISDVTLEVSLTPLYELVANLNNITKEFDCGPINVEQIVFRNVDYEFTADQGSITDIMLMEQLMSGETLKQIATKSNHCEYPYLQYVEESGMRSLSKLHFKLVQESKYPELRGYSFRNNSLTNIPDELRNLKFSFLPNLVNIDLSRNNINNLDFYLPSPRRNLNKNLLYVDMRNNVIGQVPDTFVTQLENDATVVIDLRSNPLVCSCSLYKYGDYLNQMSILDPRISQFRELSCNTYNNGHLTKHSLLDVEYGKGLCITQSAP